MYDCAQARQSSVKEKTAAAATTTTTIKKPKPKPNRPSTLISYQMPSDQHENHAHIGHSRCTQVIFTSGSTLSGWDIEEGWGMKRK